MKYFVISDVHGALDNMIRQLNKANYNPANPEHQLISCGDNFGRASKILSDSFGVYKYLTSDIHANAPICIRGNHEGIFAAMDRRNDINYVDELNGEHITLASFAETDLTEALYNTPFALERARATGVFQWIHDMPWYYEVGNYIFVHGWLPVDKLSTLAAVSADEWDEWSWAHTINELHTFAENYPHGCGKTIVFGHWGVDDIRTAFPDGKKDFSTYHNTNLNIIGLDGTTALGNSVNVYTFEEPEKI